MKVIEENCIGCGQCADFCEAIRLVAVSGYASMRHIKELCSDCGACVVEINCAGDVFKSA